MPPKKRITKSRGKSRSAAFSDKTEWNNFLEFCNKHAVANWWFRGLSDARYQLIPKIGRGFEGKNWFAPVGPKRLTTFADRETRIFNAFRRRARLGLQFLPQTDFEWLALAQHHGVPTRLLDWTPNPLMAAWFAVNDETSDDRVARIYAVRVTPIKKMDDAKIEPFKLKKRSQVFVISPHWHARVRAQRGCFSVHPTPNLALKLKDIKNDHFDIEKKHWRGFRRRLFYFGIDASTVMADLSGLGAALDWQFRNLIGTGDVGY
jgi:hypothetical protein